MKLPKLSPDVAALNPGVDLAEAPANKFHAHPCTVDGIRFDSGREAERYGELKLLQTAGQIYGLECHPAYPLLVGNHLVATYKADFRYCEPGRGWVVEDVKGVRTPAYKLKRRLMKALYDIDIIEIE